MQVVDDYDAEELFDEIEFGARADKAEAHEKIGWSIPVGEHGRVLFLKAAAEHWAMRDDLAHARELLAEIADGPDEGVLSVRAIQLTIALREDDTAEAEALLAQLLADFRKDLVTTSTCHFVGDCLQHAGELKKAHRWFTLPLSNVDPDEDLDDLEEMCVVARAGVRRQLGLPHDRYDAVADEIEALREA
ncbi:hypothetical protein NPS01_13160 [Nocardioides psychrotolerans]|uniref:Tetratricopeptide repeat-containing protein n=1 Tax=Nocardioides psychrotolerans TaxID=1005945 RepID=A0A1I3HCT4_9ACTN|nr:hypothetical protein NPS01_13160 [Nocardioides psychrotolerans]SFI33556.1 hypothetical protein SAMN05216561_107129 [Nocardioides psychrotolerans]